MLRSGLLLSTFLAAPSPKLEAQEARPQDPPLTRAQARTRGLARRVSAGVVAISSRRREILRSPIASAEASGFVIDASGLVVTTAANLGRGPVTVIFPGRVTAAARVLGRDPLSGFALVRIHDLPELEKRLGRGLKALPLGDSAGLRVGRLVFSLGDPFGSLSSDGMPSLSMGVVTRIGRLIAGSDRYRGVVIETDAAVNEGSFGGPLVDRSGRVVGMITASYSRRRWSGAAVPIDQFKRLRAYLERGETPPTATVGLVLEDSSGRAERQGPRVLAVRPKSPAARAGLAVGDRLRALDGLPIYDAEDLGRELAAIPLGTQIQVLIERRGAARSLRLTLAANVRGRPESAQRLPTYVSAEEALGARLSRGGDGVFVIDLLRAEGPAIEAGLQLGDRLLGVDGQRPRSRDELAAALASRDRVRVEVERGEWRKEFLIEPWPPAASLGAGLGPADAWGRRALVIEDPAGPAGRAGLRGGDLLLDIEDRRHPTPEQLAELIARRRPGDRLRLVVMRAGWRRVFAVTLGPRS